MNEGGATRLRDLKNDVKKEANYDDDDDDDDNESATNNFEAQQMVL